jgi:hypothetical protein
MVCEDSEMGLHEKLLGTYSKALASRIQNELRYGNLENALYLGDTFLFLFSSDTLEAKKLARDYLGYGSRYLEKQNLYAAKRCYQKASCFTSHIKKALTLSHKRLKT